MRMGRTHGGSACAMRMPPEERRLGGYHFALHHKNNILAMALSSYRLYLSTRAKCIEG